MAKYTISDIHGCKKSFEALLDKIQFNQSDELYLLGDFVDRGPDSKGVFDLIWTLQKMGHSIFCLKGNHEQMCLDSFNSKEKHDYWIRYGGRETFDSFIKDGGNAIPQEYLNFIKQMPVFFDVDQYILVHAGLNFEVPSPLEEEIAMLWIRDWYGKIDKDWLKNRIIIHGHTPTPKELIELQLKRLDEVRVLDIDAGCVFDRPGQGYLCAFELESQQLFFQANIDR